MPKEIRREMSSGLVQIEGTTGMYEFPNLESLDSGAAEKLRNQIMAEVKLLEIADKRARPF